MATINVLDSSGAVVAIEKPLAPGRAVAAASRPVALSSEDAAFLDGIEGALASINTALATVNTNLGIIDGRVDGLETLVAATNTALAAANTNLGTVDGHVDGLEAVTGITSGAAVTTDAAGTLQQYLRGLIALLAAGNVAHDAVDTTNPSKTGSKAVATLSGVTLVAAADLTEDKADLDGAKLVRQNSALGDTVSGVASNTDGASTEVLAAGASGIKHYITDVTIINMHASTDGYVELKDGSTVKWRFPAPHASGATHRFGTPIAGTAATAWNFDPSAAITTIYCSVAAFKSKI